MTRLLFKDFKALKEIQGHATHFSVWPEQDDKMFTLVEGNPKNLRDEFDLAALQPFMQNQLSQRPEENDNPEIVCARYAKWAYFMADAMLKTRATKDN